MDSVTEYLAGRSHRNVSTRIRLRSRAPQQVACVAECTEYAISVDRSPPITVNLQRGRWTERLAHRGPARPGEHAAVGTQRRPVVGTKVITKRLAVSLLRHP